MCPMTHYAPDAAVDPSYDVSEPLDLDYYGVFADVGEEDRRWWRAAREFAEGLEPRMNRH